jgi:energy-coupling factor transporter ATP-binding protein EcfA2
MEILHSISRAENMAVLMITHNEQWLKEFPASVYCCEGKKIILQSSPKKAVAEKGEAKPRTRSKKS